MDVAEESFVAVEFSRTLLARVAPSFAHRCATKLFRANNTLQLPLAHVVVDFRETWPRPVIFKSQTLLLLFSMNWKQQFIYLENKTKCPKSKSYILVERALLYIRVLLCITECESLSYP